MLTSQSVDVIDALSRMLQLQIGQPVTIVVTPTAEDAWELAEQVAANSDFNTAMFKSATRLGDRRTKFWAASQAFKPEDNPRLELTRSMADQCSKGYTS